MKEYLLTIVIATGVFYGAPVQAAPVLPDIASLQGQAGSDVQKVWHCRWYSGGWGCRGGHNRWRSHYRWGSGRRW